MPAPATPPRPPSLFAFGFTSSTAARTALARIEQHLAEPLARIEATDASVARWTNPDHWPEALAIAADPDQALTCLQVLAERAPEQLVALVASGDMDRLVLVAGASAALARHLEQHPGDLAAVREQPWPSGREELVHRLLAAVEAHEATGQVPVTRADPDAMIDQLRLANRRELVRIAAHDLASADPEAIVDQVGAELADLADAVVEAGLAIARAQVEDHACVRLAVIAMGKCGGQELNYLSDVDVVFVAEPSDEQVEHDHAIKVGSQLASHLMTACSKFTGTGTIWQLDAGLRPEGQSGPLVRTLAGMGAYYEKWAKTWEFQALLKARPMAGDLPLGQQFVELVAPRVWSVATSEGFMAQTQAMRKRVISLVPAKEAAREIKLGAGGLRDTEFPVQVLQLVHGRTDESLRTRSTLESLARLVQGGYIGRDDGAEMGQRYRFQRVLEHRVQLARLRRTHLVPADEEARRILARSMRGYRSEAASPVEDGEQLFRRWRQSTIEVQRLQQRIFYSPLLETVASLGTDELRLSDEAVRARMEALGFADPRSAIRHIQALTQGSGRAASIQRHLMPAMLGWLAETPSPDAGLLAFRTLSEALQDSPWYLRAVRDEGHLAPLLARVLATSRYVSDLLRRAPQTLELFAQEANAVPVTGDAESAALALPDQERLTTSVRAILRRHPGRDEAVQALRAFRRRELLRVATADLTGALDQPRIGRALSAVGSATMQAILDIAQREVPDAPPVSVVALGRWGGREASYGSDADAMFVIEDTDDPEAIRLATQVATRVRTMLPAHGAEPAFEVDADLRPEGKGGPLVRTLGSYRTYYQRWASTWERQALVRATHGAGPDAVTGQLFAVVDPLRYPEGGLDRSQVTEIRSLKARMERERLPRSVPARRHLKLGPGGLSDVEWTVQLLQLQHAHLVPELRVSGTLEALAAAEQADLVSPADASALRAAWLLASRIRDKNMLTRGRANDMLPDGPDLANVCFLLGMPPGSSAELLDDYLKASRRAAAVVQRLFWGQDH